MSANKAEPKDASANGKEDSSQVQSTVKEVKSKASTIGKEFPDGGRDAWLTLLGADTPMHTAFIHVYLTFRSLSDRIKNFLAYYTDVYLKNYPQSTIGWTGSCQIFLLLSTGIFSGAAFDNGHFYLLMRLGSLCQVFCLFMLSLSHEGQFYQVFLAHFGATIGSGITYIPSMTIVGHYFNRHRPMAMGLTTAGSSVGGIVHSIILNKMFDSERIGFHNGVRISAGFNAVLLIVANLIMKTRLPPKKGLKTDYGKFARDVPYVLCVVSGILLILGLFYPIFYLQILGLRSGVDKDLAFYFLAVLNAASGVGRVLPLAFAPRIGVINIMIIFSTLSAILIFLVPFVKGAGGVGVYGALYGFMSGATIAAWAPVYASLASDLSEVGKRIGVAYFFCGLMGFGSTPIAGALLTDDFIWWRPSVFCGTTFLAAAVIFAIARYLVAKSRSTHWV